VQTNGGAGRANPHGQPVVADRVDSNRPCAHGTSGAAPDPRRIGSVMRSLRNVPMAKLFTLQEAEELIPSLEEWLPEAIDAKKQAIEADGELQKIVTRIQLMGGLELNPAQVSRFKHVKKHAVRRLQDAMEQIEESGCVVKDLDLGLIDFPAMLGEQQVFLCWKLGERRIEFWHGIHEGFAGRKPIDSEFGPSSEGDKLN
jgi:hypothetical protein